MSLTKEKRDSLPASDFAVPEKRALPIHDAVHVKMAHNMLSKTSDLTAEEKSEAQKRIVNKAHELGIDTSNWNLEASKVLSFSAMAIDIPHVDNHPNKTPFKGVLTKLNQPSDYPPGGSNSNRVLITSAVAEKALASLMGMGVDFTDNFEGHDAQKKIGVITAANVVGDDLEIEGFFYGADFPVQVKRIQAEINRMGFSFEAQVLTKSMSDDLLEIIECVFTGAAVLYKDKAAYTTTSITAHAEDKQMTTDILDAIKALGERVDGFAKQIEEVKASSSVQANSVYAMVKPHADAMHATADAMEKAGIGLHEKNGHVAHMRTMANSMCAEAAMGRMPHIYRDHDFYSASASATVDSKASEEIKALQASIEALTTKVVDSEKARLESSASPARKTLAPEIMTLIAKGGIEAEGDKKFEVDAIDKAFAEKGLSVRSRFTNKLLMNANGMIEGVK